MLEVNALKTYFFTRSGAVKAVDGVSFALERGETLAIVGESGCGKSVTALSLMRLIPDPPGRIVGGSISLDGVDILALNDDEMRAMRGRDISMIFQEPMTSLNPVMTIGRQLGEVLAPAPDAVQIRAASKSRRAAVAGADTGSRPARPAISASTVRRHAPARDDRDRIGLQSESADRGRADHRARRHRAGADPRTDRRPAEKARHRRDPDHPRSRPRRADRAARHRDVCGPQGGGGDGRARCSPAPSINTPAA